jgi:hypothetical protein
MVLARAMFQPPVTRLEHGCRGCPFASSPPVCWDRWFARWFSRRRRDNGSSSSKGRAPRHSFVDICYASQLASMESFDLDDAVDFQNVVSRLSDHRTRNFVARFGAGQAACAVDLTSEHLTAAVLPEGNLDSISTRWLNLWSYDRSEREALLAILASYGVSRRLTHLLCPPTPPPARVAEGEKGATATQLNRLDTDSTDSDPIDAAGSTRSALNDAEKEQATTLNMDHVMKDLWPFCSIDWGHRYTCISYNSLFTTKSDEYLAQSRQPQAIRIWSSIVLFDDGLVISNFESPPGLPPQHLKTTRKNQVNVLKNLSWLYDPTQTEANIFQVDVRPVKPPAGTEAADFDAAGTASRIFYYLFDDWRATFELVSGRHHPYRRRLDSIKTRMSRAPAVEDIEKLHHIGQQLVVLQRVYEGYEKIIDRLLQRQRQLSTSFWRTARRSQSQLPLLYGQGSDGTQPAPITDQTLEVPTWITESDNDQKTVRLPLGTIARFERLLDRIRLYALKEIEECAAEKESLVLLVSAASKFPTS